jgi:arylsulfatase A-like enzyme
MENKSSQPDRDWSTLYLSAWFGLCAGFCEILCLGVQKYLLRQPIYFGLHIVWMAPLANMLLFFLIGLLLIAVRITSLRVKIGVMTFLGLLGCSLIFPQLKFYASVLLAGGVAWRAGLFAAAHAQGFCAFARRSARWMAFAAMALCAGVFGWQRHLTARASTPLAEARPNAMNVLLIVMDTVRAHNLSLYGYGRQTAPRLEQFARTGARFDRAIAAAPWTLPSHAAMFTGRFPDEISADFRAPLDSAHPTLAEALRARGYLTAGFVANTFYCNAENGLGRGFAHYEDYPFSASEFALSASLSRAILNRDAVRRLINFHDVIGRKSAEEINREFLNWLDGRNDRPFFAFLNYFDAHEPCLPPAPFNEKFGPRINHGDFRSIHLLRTSWRQQRETSTPQTLQADMDCYDGAIAYLDGQIGRLLDDLERRGRRKNTLIIITADHGEAFGENGHYGHIDSAYLTQLRVPLLISMPGVVPAGRVITEPITLRDLAATVLDLTGVPQTFPGTSLARHWRASPAPAPVEQKSPLLSEINIAPSHPREYKEGMKAIVTSLVFDRYHFLKNPDGRQELYDYLNDPLEQRDLGDSSEYRELMESFKDFLRQQNEHRSVTNVD